jgi:hypothetical protein
MSIHCRGAGRTKFCATLQILTDMSLPTKPEHSGKADNGKRGALSVFAINPG